jgi:hypothetical protein
VKREHEIDADSVERRAHVGAIEVRSHEPVGRRAHVGATEVRSHETVEHQADLTIRADDVEPGGGTEVRAHVGVPTQSRLERTTIRTQTLDALVGLGFKRHEARSAVDEALAHFGNAVLTLESFLRVALAKSPRPRTG